MEFIPKGFSEDNWREVLSYSGDPWLIEKALSDSQFRQIFKRSLLEMEEEDVHDLLNISIGYPSVIRFILQNRKLDDLPEVFIGNVIHNGDIETIRYLFEERKEKKERYMVKKALFSGNFEMFDYFADFKKEYDDYGRLIYNYEVVNILTEASLYGDVDFLKKIYQKYGSFLNEFALSEFIKTALNLLINANVKDKELKYKYLIDNMKDIENIKYLPLLIYSDFGMFSYYVEEYGLHESIVDDVFRTAYYNSHKDDSTLYYLLEKYPYLREKLFDKMFTFKRPITPENIYDANQSLKKGFKTIELVYDEDKIGLKRRDPLKEQEYYEEEEYEEYDEEYNYEEEE